MYKGIGIAPVINALKMHARGRQEVPDALQHYLADDVVLTGWYPESDFIALTQSLARALESDGTRDVWSYFGRVAAARDLAGIQDSIPVERRARSAGLYRRFASDETVGLATWLVRVGKLWELYHDTGRLVIGRSPSLDCGALIRLLDFPLLLPSGMLQLLAAYYTEYARIMGLRVTVHFVGASTGKVACTEWEARCERTPENLEVIASLPALP